MLFGVGLAGVARVGRDVWAGRGGSNDAKGTLKRDDVFLQRGALIFPFIFEHLANLRLPSLPRDVRRPNSAALLPATPGTPLPRSPHHSSGPTLTHRTNI